MSTSVSSPTPPSCCKVLTAACARRGLDPSVHRLRRPQAKKPLDESLSVRLSNLSNRARLEVVELTEEEKKQARLEGLARHDVQTNIGNLRSNGDYRDNFYLEIPQFGP